MAKVLFSVGGSSGLGWGDYIEIGKACDVRRGVRPRDT